MSEIISTIRATKFKELAEKRVNKVIKGMRLIGNLSNRKNYSYTSDEAKKIVNALQKELVVLKKRFDSSGDENEDSFKF